MLFDEGLLSPLTAGYDARVSDTAVLDALVTAEVALARAYGALGVAPGEAVADLTETLGWIGEGAACRDHGIMAATIASAAVSGGNPVIPLVGELRQRVPEDARIWVHRGATSQDIVDSALMFVARAAVEAVLTTLDEVEAALVTIAAAHRDTVAAARTLTQHAVPTTVGLRAALWMLGIRRARFRLAEAQAALPAQLGGAGGTLASFVEIAGREHAAALPAAFARELGLAAPEFPWHTTRWPITELGDALVQVVAALGVLGTDVATLGRTEIAELSTGSAGGSSAMPQKQNPVDAVLLRSGALRAPQLGATLHLAAGSAADERPDGAWHAEWPTLRELLRITLGAAAHAASLTEHVTINTDAVAKNLASTHGLIVSERLSAVLTPRIHKEGVAGLVADLRNGVALDPQVEALLDPADYTGLAGEFVDRALREDS